ncbi:hypothetical protein ARMGADRAFT_936817, partial [Armillaria gallica]
VTKTVQTATNIHYTFNMFCYDFGNLSGLDDIHLAWFIVSVLSGFVVCIIQLFYTWQMYKFGKKAQWLCITLSVVRFLKKYLRRVLYSIINDLQIWLGGSFLCNTAIALCMTYFLSQSQTGLKSTRILLSRLIWLTIKTGTATG